MASNVRPANQAQRKQDRTHATQGQQRAHVAALQRQRRQGAE